jgi:HEAT repeat protein
MASLETLIRALSDRDERAVIAAMDILVDRDRCSLIPSLIFYHPSPRVVARAIDIFARGGREEVLDFSDRLLVHEYAAVRAAIVRASAALAPNREQLEDLSKQECPCIRVSAVSGLLAQNWISDEVADREFQLAIAHPEPETRLAVATSARIRYSEIFRASLSTLVADSNVEVAREAVRAIKISGDPEFTGTLIASLHDRRVRDLVREVLVERGDEALAVLCEALTDPETPAAVRRHIPRTIALFECPSAVEALLDALEDLTGGVVHYKILRGLQTVLAGPCGVHVDVRQIGREMDLTVERALDLFQIERDLKRGQEADAMRRTAGGMLLRELVRDKRSLAVGRIFLLLALLHPGEDLGTIETGLRSDAAKSRASAIELLENILSHERSREIVGLASLSAMPDGLELPGSGLTDRELDYDVAMRTLAADDSTTVRAFALYHAGEIGLEVGDSAAPRDLDRDAAPLSLRDAALGLIEQLPEVIARRTMLAGDAKAT